MDKFEAFETQLYSDLEVRRRAISNWKKLRLLLVLFQMTGSTQEEPNVVENAINDFATEKKLSCHERIAFYIISPKSPYKVAWDLLSSCIYVACFIMDPLVFAVRF